MISMNLYSILNVLSSCTPEEIKRAYYSKALQFHPDRNKDPKAKDMFQQVSLAYEVLSNEDRRKVYDRTGLIENFGEMCSWKDFMDAAIPKVDFKQLDEFKDSYIGSVEEYEDMVSRLERFELIAAAKHNLAKAKADPSTLTSHDELKRLMLEKQAAHVDA